MKLQVDCRCGYPSGFCMKIHFSTESSITRITGQSGVGKTTALKAIAGLVQPEHGQILFNDLVLFDSNQKENIPAKDRPVGMVFQDSLLFPHLNVRDNLLYGKKRNHRSQVSLDEVAGRLEIDDLLNRRPHSLSGGQARRVAIGRALVQCPRLLLLDEPFTGLDSRRRLSAQQLIQDISTANDISILISAHEDAEELLVAGNHIHFQQIKE